MIYEVKPETYPRRFHVTRDMRHQTDVSFYIEVEAPVVVTNFQRFGTCRCTRCYPVVMSSITDNAVQQGADMTVPNGASGRYICDCYGLLM